MADSAEDEFWKKARAKIKRAHSIEEMCEQTITAALAGERVAVVVPSERDADAVLELMRAMLDAVYTFGTTASEVLERITFTVVAAEENDG